MKIKEALDEFERIESRRAGGGRGLLPSTGTPEHRKGVFESTVVPAEVFMFEGCGQNASMLINVNNTFHARVMFTPTAIQQIMNFCVSSLIDPEPMKEAAE